MHTGIPHLLASWHFLAVAAGLGFKYGGSAGKHIRRHCYSAAAVLNPREVSLSLKGFNY
jgi:hypothetical protein